jgi:hypothetical protein
MTQLILHDYYTSVTADQHREIPQPTIMTIKHEIGDKFA